MAGKKAWRRAAALAGLVTHACAFVWPSTIVTDRSTRAVRWSRGRPPASAGCSRLQAFRGRHGLVCSVNTYEDLSNGHGGCSKQIIREGDPSDGFPTKGAKISVHYDVRVLGGDHVDSSREKGEPFEFYLGRWPSEAMFGWEKALPTMRRGEVATVVCGPRYAFGAKGAPPKIPPNATLECELELLDWVDFTATYNAVSPDETYGERAARWRRDIEAGTSPMRDDMGVDKAVQSALEQKRLEAEDATPAAAPAAAPAPQAGPGSRPGGTGATGAGPRSAAAGQGPTGPAAVGGPVAGGRQAAAGGAGPGGGPGAGPGAGPGGLGAGGGVGGSGKKRVIDVNSEEGKRLLARQTVQGYGEGYGYVEKTTSINMYIPIPHSTSVEDIECEIRPRHLRLAVAGRVLVSGELDGRVDVDGCYWLLTDLSLERPDAENKRDVRRGPAPLGETCVEVFLEKQRPFDKHWPEVFKPAPAALEGGRGGA